MASNNRRTLALQVVVKAYEDAELWRKPIKRKWDKHFRLMQGLHPKDQKYKAWQTDRMVPLIGLAMDLLGSRFYQGLPVAQAQGLTLESSLNEDKMNQVLDFDQDRMGLELTMDKFIKDGLGFALGIMRTGWKTETAGNLPHSTSFLDKMIAQMKKLMPGVKLTDYLYDGPTVNWVDPLSFYWDPKGDTIDDCSFVIERTEESTYDLQRDPSIDRKIIRQLTEAALNEESYGKNLRDRMAALGYSEVEIKRQYERISSGVHEVLRYWGAFDIDGDGLEEECRITVIDGILLGTFEENPYNHGQKPYTVWQFDLVPGFLNGRSIPDRLEQLQLEFNDNINQLGDIRKIVARPMVKFKLGGQTDPETLQVAPGMPIGLENMDDLEWYQPDVSAIPALLELLSFERELFQLISGINDVSLGQQDVGIGDNTATGSTIAQEQTELRYKQPAILLDLAIERFGQQLISLEQQYRKRKMTVPIKDDATGKTTYQQFAPKDYSGLYSYKIVSGSLSQQSPTLKLNNLKTVLEIINGDPNYNPTEVKDEMLREMNFDPSQFKMAQTNNLDEVQKFAALPPQQQQAALAQMNPDDRALMMKALSLIPNPNAQSNQTPPQPGGPSPMGTPAGQPVSGPAPAITRPAPVSI